MAEEIVMSAIKRITEMSGLVPWDGREKFDPALHYKTAKFGVIEMVPLAFVLRQVGIKYGSLPWLRNNLRFFPGDKMPVVLVNPREAKVSEIRFFLPMHPKGERISAGGILVKRLESWMEKLELYDYNAQWAMWRVYVPASFAAQMIAKHQYEEKLVCEARERYRLTQQFKEARNLLLKEVVSLKPGQRTCSVFVEFIPENGLIELTQAACEALSPNIQSHRIKKEEGFEIALEYLVSTSNAA